jgi:lactoylglutathione lyase
MIGELTAVEVVTLFVEDLSAAKAFYKNVFGPETVYQDDVSSVLKFGNLMINLLQASRAQTLVEPAPVAGPGLGSRALFTINVKDAGSICRELEQHGVQLLNGPIDRPWGRRTAAFADPAGNVWEIAQKIPLSSNSTVESGA